MGLLSGAFNDAADAAQAFSGAAGDLIAASGKRTERDAYFKAREMSLVNADLEGQNLASEQSQRRIQLALLKQNNLQDQRTAFLAAGQQKAVVSASGLATSGSALDLIRDTARQGAMATQIGKSQENISGIQSRVADTQGQININSYLTQASSLQAQGYSADSAADALEASAAGKTAAGAIKTGSSLIHFLTLGIF